METKWEEIDKLTHRLKVPGGWLVRSIYSVSYAYGAGCSVHTVFVEEVGHNWVLESNTVDPHQARRGDDDV